MTHNKQTKTTKEQQARIDADFWRSFNEAFDAIDWSELETLAWPELETLAWPELEALAWPELEALAWPELEALAWPDFDDPLLSSFVGR